MELFHVKLLLSELLCCSPLSSSDCVSLDKLAVRRFTGIVDNRESRIRYITISNRGIQNIERKTFSDLPNLKHLNLSHNEISQLQGDTFEDLSHLKQLSLSHNYLSKIEKEVFSHLTSLEILILDQNLLEDINGVFMVLVSLKYISLVNNNVKWFDVAFFPKSVHMINIGHNSIEEIGNYYKMFEDFSLSSLDVSHNNIGRLEAQIFVESLQEINLEGNKISKIAAGTFSDLSSLRSVNLRNNLLRTVSRISLQIVGRGEL